MKNQLSQMVKKLEKKPVWLRYRLLSFALGATVKFVGTAGIKCLHLSDKKAIFKLKNKKKVRNHIATVHAAATALVAETASGMALGMHIPDGKIPLLKMMQIEYVKRSSGGLTAEAYLTKAQIEQLHADDRGAFVVACKVTDDAGNEPVHCQFEWAWTPSQR